MTEKNIDAFTQKNNNIPEHPGPKADTTTPYEDDDDEEGRHSEQQKKITIDIEEYFEIVLMTSPMAGVKYYMPIREPCSAYALTVKAIEKHKVDVKK